MRGMKTWEPSKQVASIVDQKDLARFYARSGAISAAIAGVTAVLAVASLLFAPLIGDGLLDLGLSEESVSHDLFILVIGATGLLAAALFLFGSFLFRGKAAQAWARHLDDQRWAESESFDSNTGMADAAMIVREAADAASKAAQAAARVAESAALAAEQLSPATVAAAQAVEASNSLAVAVAPLAEAVKAREYAAIAEEAREAREARAHMAHVAHTESVVVPPVVLAAGSPVVQPPVVQPAEEADVTVISPEPSVVEVVEEPVLPERPRYAVDEAIVVEQAEPASEPVVMPERVDVPVAEEEPAKQAETTQAADVDALIAKVKADLETLLQSVAAK